MSASMTRMKFGNLDLAVIDPHERDTDYIYEEIFTRRIYHHPNFRVPPKATILDVGANIGLYSIWAAREYQPARIFAYEASPATYRYLADNVGRHFDNGTTSITCVNRAVSSSSGMELVLKQAPFISGISTMLDEGKIDWVRDLQKSGELVSHKTMSTTVSDELAKHGSARIDMLKIDVEGHFMEVLAGISAADFDRIANIVMEVEYLEVLELSEEQICEFLRAKRFVTEARDQTIYAWR